MNTIEFFVPGVPKPAGSKKAFPFRRKNGKLGVAVTDDCKGTKTWQNQVSSEGFAWASQELLTGPLRLSVVFVMPRPKCHFGTGKKSCDLKPSAPTEHIQKPDRGKLLRAVEDALTNIIWKDDSQIIGGEPSKCWADPGEQCGALIRIEPVQATTQGD